MDTSEYADKRERNRAKKISRHPLFQKMRERALDAEARVVTVKQDLAKRIDLHDKDGIALLKARKENKAFRLEIDQIRLADQES